jgi:hypothetical protein
MVNVSCLCPRKGAEVRHPAGDTINLKERLDFRTALTMRKSVVLLKTINEEASTEEILAVLTESYLLYGVESWSLVDAKDQPIPVNATTVGQYLLADLEAADAVADEAEDRYSAVVLLPLLKGALTSSPPTPTSDSTSATNGSSPEPPKPSKRSSTITSLTDSTETTSVELAGVSSS